MTQQLRLGSTDDRAAEPGRQQSGPVECLGLSFESDEARREYFTERLREKLQDPEFRAIEGFPIGSDEDILALSDPPYYTACPNPFLDEFIEQYGKPYDESTDDYHREPFAADVSEGKNDPIYNAHSYHTKVPHKAIMRYILHYTEPGDVVFDGFCGTGMTGVAAQMCGDRKTVESLGYKVTADGVILDEEGEPFSRLGARRAILNDLSPAATFIAYNYNTPVDVEEFEREARRILSEVEAECGWMYQTLHQPKPEQIDEAISLLDDVDALKESSRPFGRINYTVWSDVFVCPTCSAEVVFWEAAVDKAAGAVRDEFPCPDCGAMLTKRRMERAWVTKYDEAIEQTIRQAKQVPVLINYSVGKKRYEKTPDRFDLGLIQHIEDSPIPYWFPTDRMPEGEESRRNDDAGITHVHHFFTIRNLSILAAINSRISSTYQGLRVKHFLEVWFTSSHSRLHRLNRYMAQHSRHVGPLSGTLYISSTMAEISPFYFAAAKLKDHAAVSTPEHKAAIEIGSAGDGHMPCESADYVFTDPPFGGNLMYSELNFLWEAWLRLTTNNQPEAIQNRVQSKGLAEYQSLMLGCFEEYFRVLKPGRWMTVEFHNSSNAVWNAIQEALQRSGFVIADVRTLDKQKGTTKQLTLANATKQDLVISSYKPRRSFTERFEREAGTEQGAWDFIRQHLENLPVFVSSSGKLQIIAERQNYLLYDRMLAYHIQHGVTIPLSAAEFYAGLKQKFPERDGMYFLPDQVAEYDQKRLEVDDVEQLSLFVSDEQSTIQWLRQELGRQAQTYQELHPKFLRELHRASHEQLPELSEILEQNFLRDERDRWYVPDPSKQSDLEKLRERALLREFEEYTQGKGKLKVFRTEAVRAGFGYAWKQRDYQRIVKVASRLPEVVLQEDPQLLMYYDNASERV